MQYRIQYYHTREVQKHNENPPNDHSGTAGEKCIFLHSKSQFFLIILFYAVAGVHGLQ
jgi:hypothetical protein